MATQDAIDGNDLAALVEEAVRSRPGLDRRAFAEHLASLALPAGGVVAADLAPAARGPRSTRACGARWPTPST